MVPLSLHFTFQTITLPKTSLSGVSFWMEVNQMLKHMPFPHTLPGKMSQEWLQLCSYLPGKRTGASPGALEASAPPSVKWKYTSSVCVKGEMNVSASVAREGECTGWLRTQAQQLERSEFQGWLWRFSAVWPQASCSTSPHVTFPIFWSNILLWKSSNTEKSWNNYTVSTYLLDPTTHILLYSALS